eukprot:TRINITY_DN57835_c0_g1_i1.p1 TRINITY_DN57835_c0_g1~~TRINITY_DN57835_c0_g1_i1.p1  ORF type:complete len:119 (+),score=6.74 TRINITY_DN57835_c0_g1_i1:51-407(+)
MVGIAHQPHPQQKKKFPSCCCVKHSLVAGDHRYSLIDWMLGSVHRPVVLSRHGRIQEGRSQHLVTIEQDTIPEPTNQTNKTKDVIKEMSPVAVFIIIIVYLSLRQDRQTSTLLYNSTQ